jgi:SAM-dependent methyltransferase
MTEENNSIHDFDFALVCEYFAGVERQGPGSTETTLKALSFVDNLNEKSKIADIGCGAGTPSLLLAKHAPGNIIAIDLFPQFIDILNNRAAQENLCHKIAGKVGSMDALEFMDEELDLIWSEGAIYNIGFEHGLNYWKKFLKKGAYIAVSEASWFTNERPAEINDFWENAYPEIDTIPNKLSKMQNAGYVPVACFILPENCWTHNFYDLQIQVQTDFLKKYADSKTAADLVANERREAELYYKYKDYYGYVFYIGRKI